MKVATASVQFEDDARARTFPNFPSKGNYQSFDIGEYNAASGWNCEDRFKDSPMLCIHIV